MTMIEQVTADEGVRVLGAAIWQMLPTRQGQLFGLSSQWI
jgi:hypothetical protein